MGVEDLEKNVNKETNNCYHDIGWKDAGRQVGSFLFIAFCREPLRDMFLNHTFLLNDWTIN